MRCGNLIMGSQGLALSLYLTTHAHGFVIASAESEGHGPDTEVTVYLYEKWPSPGGTGACKTPAG